MSYRDNVVVITGASSGIGAALALELAGQGARLVLAARRADALEQVAAQCRAAGAQVLCVTADVSVQTDCQRLVAETVAHYGRLDVLVNNAGITMWAKVAELQDPALLEQITRVNFLGAAWCTAYALPHLKASQGRITFISSMASLIVAPGNTGYVASKQAMGAFSESLRAEVSADGVSVTLIHLGFVDTGFAGRMLDASGRPSAGIAHMLRGTRQMTAAESARLIAQATAARRRLVYTRVNGLPGWLFPYLRLLAPGLLERAGRRFMEQSGL